MAEGQWGAAARVMWSAIRLEWTKGINALSAAWDTFSFGVQRRFAEATALIVATHEDAVYRIARGMVNAQADAKSLGQITKAWFKKIGVAIDSGMAGLTVLADRDLTPEQRQRQLDKIDQRAKRKVAAIDASGNAELEKINREHEERQEAGRKMHEDRMAEISEMEIEAKRTLTTEQNANEINAQLALDKARQEFNEAVAAADRATESARMEREDAPNRELHTDAGSVVSQLRRLDIKKLAKEATRSRVAGTFSGWGAGLIGGSGNKWDRLLTAAERTAKNTDRLARERGGGMTWR